MPKRKAMLQLVPTSTPKKRRLAQTQVIMRVPRNNLANPRSRGNPPELKFVDVAGSLGIINPTQWSELDLLNPIATGTNASDRIGRKIQMKSILFRWNGSGLSNFYAFRILLVYDREPNGVLPTILDVLEGNNFNSPNNLSNGNRFIILADQLHENHGYNQNNISVTTGTGLYRAGKIYKKINLPEHFNAGTSLDITSITAGAIYAIVGIPGASSISAGIGYWSRIRYTDV